MAGHFTRVRPMRPFRLPRAWPLSAVVRRRQPSLLLLASACAALLSSACERHDLGKPCPGLEVDSPVQNGGRTTSGRSVGQSTCFACTELICVALDGKPSYCSKKCSSDVGCPPGFSCQVVQPKGEAFGGQSFCVWQACESDEDCGDPNLRCRTVPNSDPAGDLKRCDYINADDLFGPVENVTCNDESAS